MEIKCQACEKVCKNLKNHLSKAHQLKYEDYLKQYDQAEYERNEIAEQLKDLYLLNPYQFYEMDTRGEYFHQDIYENIKKKDGRKYPLATRDFIRHLDGLKTLAMDYGTDKTKVIGFDIDCKNEDLLERICQVLNNLLGKDKILSSYSGTKGYHIDIFLDKYISKDNAESFYNLVLNEANFIKEDGMVELKGFGSYKIPLGYNYKNKYIEQGYCFLCNEFGIEIKEPCQFFVL